MTQSRNFGCVSRFRITFQTQKTRLSEIYFQFFFKVTLFLAKMVKINPPYILKEAIYFAEIIKSSSLALANLKI